MAVFPEKLTLMNPRPGLGTAPLFSAGGVVYTVDDAVASAIFTGALDEAVEETAALCIAEECAEEEGVQPAAEALQRVSEKFRYEHDLISAGETEGWLESRGLRLDDFTGWLYQRLCRSACAVAGISLDDFDVPNDLSDLLRVHLWMSDGMEDLSEQLERRVAAGLEISKGGNTILTDSEMQSFLGRHRLDDRLLAGWLAARDRDDEWLAETVKREAAFNRAVSLALTPEARARKLSAMQMSLAKIELETLEFGSEAAAKEAFLCVREDGESLSEIANESGYHAERLSAWLTDLDDTLGRRILGAGAGEVLGPVQSRGRFQVCQVLRRIEPSLSDPAVLSRIDEVIIDEFFDELCGRHVHVHDVARSGK